MTSLKCNFGRTAEDYARYRAGFPDWLFDRLGAMGLKLAGARSLDLGTGTGLLARALALRGASVTGIDPSPEMLVEARKAGSQSGRTIRYIRATAERTGQGDNDYDLVTAGTCWHWFDRPAAAKETMRVLAPGGALLICSLDWLPLPGNLVAHTEKLVQKHNPNWSLRDGDGLKPIYVHDLRAAGFQNIQSISVDYQIEYSKEAWRGRVRASAGVAASLGEEQVLAFDAELADLLRRDYPSDPLLVDHCVFAAIGWKSKAG